MIKMSRQAKCHGQRSFCPKVIVRTHTHTHTHTLKPPIALRGN